MKTKVGMSRLNLLAQIQRVKDILGKMTGNPFFTTPTPPLMMVDTKAQETEQAVTDYENARQTCEEAKAVRDAKMAELLALVNQLATYVDNTSNGDTAKILSSGFGVRAEPEPYGELPAPQNLRALANGSETSAHLEWDHIPGAHGYTVQSSDEPTGPWRFDGSVSKARSNVNNLQTGSRRYFRVCAFGAEGNGPWSDIASKIIGA